MAKRPTFSITTTGINLNPELDALPAMLGPENEASRQFQILVDNSDVTGLLHAHTMAVNKFIDAVAKGIKKKPEDLVVDYYKPFVSLLEHWAANYKAQHVANLPQKFLLGAGGITAGNQEEESDTEMPSPPAPKPATLFLEQPITVDLLSYKMFKAKVYAKSLQGDARTNEFEISQLLNYLKYLFLKTNSGEDYPDKESIWQDMAWLTVDNQQPLSIEVDGRTTVEGKPGPPKTLTECFFAKGPGKIKLKQKLKPAAPSPPTTTPSRTTEITAFLEFLFQHEAEAATASNLVEFYKYSVLPKRFSNRLFGPDLIFGIGQAMQSLRQTFHFRQTITNDELFADFVNDENWRDLFVSLVVKSILLGEKYSSFNPPKGVIEMLKREIESISVRFRGFQKFNQTFPSAAAPLKYNI